MRGSLENGNKVTWGGRLVGFFLCVVVHQAVCLAQAPTETAISLRLNRFDYDMYNRSILENTWTITGERGTKEVIFDGNRWMVSWGFNSPGEGLLDGDVQFALLEGEAGQTAPSVDFTFSDWSAENYVLLPGAAYNGNRFLSRKIPYSPKLMDPRDIGSDHPPIVSDVPRLNIADGPSRIQERSGSMTLPAGGFYAPGSKQVIWITFPQRNEWGDYGFTVTENRNRDQALFSLTSPVVRETYKYRITDMQFPSDDRAPGFKKGDTVLITFRLMVNKGEQIQDLFDHFFEIRNRIADTTQTTLSIPLSACFEVQEEKFNTQNFVKDQGYYAVGMRNGKYPFLQDWQIGWTGGMISTYPLLFAGEARTIENVISNFDWLFPDGICPAGFFWDAGELRDGTFHWYGGDIRKPNTKNWHLIRKSGDAIYYIIKQFMLMEQKGIPVKDEWKQGTRQVCSAFVSLWNRYRQFGQFVNSLTGEIAVGGSTSGAIVPAGLVLASRYFDEPKYLEVAKASADHYYTNYVQQGITSGGPGDALQNPDSESSYVMIESFMQLYEETGDQKWLRYAEEMARQFATWVMAYDYTFPEESTLGQLGIETTGAVFANTQNKHGAPGICTHSGVALLRLYRATGNAAYLELLQDIARHIPQNLSHPLKPIAGMKTGWMSERVSTTDWLEGIGELMYGSTWAETALMLTYVEIPGVYVQPDESSFHVFDQVKVKRKSDDSDQMTLSITNPGRSGASVKIVVENDGERAFSWGENRLYNARQIELAPYETKEVVFSKAKVVPGGLLNEKHEK